MHRGGAAHRRPGAWAARVACPATTAGRLQRMRGPPPARATSYGTIVSTAAAELASTLAAVDPAATAAAVDAISTSHTIVTAGVGREGLAMKGLAMRLFHAGLAASAVGEMATPRLGPGGLLVASAGPGYFSTIAALADTARSAGARTLVLTAQPPEGLRVAADVVVRIPARTMADDHGDGGGGGAAGPSSVLPLGSAYELALQLYCDAVAALVTARVGGEGGGDLAARHTNLE